MRSPANWSVGAWACTLVVLVAGVLGAQSGAATARDASVGAGLEWKVGGSVGFRPSYEGSDEIEAIGFPLIMPVLGDGPSWFRDRVAFHGLDDVRFKLLARYYGFEAGPLLGYSFGRDEDDGDRLTGLGDVDGGLIIGAFATYRWHFAFATVSYHYQATGGTDASQLRFALGGTLPVSQRMKLNGKVGTTYADDNYQQAFFGISQAQSARSAAGLPVYSPDAGIKDVFIEGGAEFDLSDSWQLTTLLRYSRLVGDAADSPVVEAEDQLSGRLGIVYRFRR